MQYVSGISSKKTGLFLPMMTMAAFLLTSHLFAQKVAAPVLNYESGRYNHPINVTLHCAMPGASIYYTTDGSDPDETSTLYTGVPILVANHASGDTLAGVSDNDPAPDDSSYCLSLYSMTIKAVAVKPGMENSDVVEAIYVLDLVDGSFNIAYADPPPAGGGKHLLDVYQPCGRTGTPVLLFIHGGAWMQGDKNLYMELGNTFSGYYNVTTVVASYQISSDPWNAKHPTHIKDVAMAFRWVHEHIAEYGGDSTNISIFGQSAGGHLVSLLATDSTYLDSIGQSVRSIKRVISMSGAYDLYALVKWPMNPLDLTAQEVLEYKALCANAFGSWDDGILDAASPQSFINSKQPPFYLITLNTTSDFKDMPGFPREAESFYNAISDLDGPFVQLDSLNKEDIPPEIVVLDFPGDTDGHYQEIYAINTRNWDSRSTKMIAGYLDVLPQTPAPLSPAADAVVDSVAELTWRRSSLSSYYHLQASSSATFAEEDIIFDARLADTTWTLADLPADSRVYWRVSGASAAGESEFSTVQSFRTGGAAAVDGSETSLPRQWSLSLYPNPFNGILSIFILAPQKAGCSLTVYDVLGRAVDAMDIVVQQGENKFAWKPKEGLPSGVYFVGVELQRFGVKRRALLLK